MNYFVIRNYPPFGDMDPETRRQHARMLVGKLFWFQVTFGGIFLYMFYAIFLSGYDCAGEAFVVQEDPRRGFMNADKVTNFLINHKNITLIKITSKLVFTDLLIVTQLLTVYYYRQASRLIYLTNNCSYDSPM